LKTKKLIKEAISLPIEEKTILIDSLIKSINPQEAEIEKKWIAAAKKRLADIRAGKLQARIGKDVLEGLWNKFE